MGPFPVSTLEKFRFQFGSGPDPDLAQFFFNNEKFVQSLAFSMYETALFPRKLASNV